MQNNPSNIVVLIAGVIVVILQLLVAPFLNLFGATPNFIFAFTLALSVVLTDRPHIVCAFLLGALYDFSQGSTLGAWMLLLLLSALLIHGFAQNLDASNVVACLILGIVFCVIANVLHMLIVVITTPAISLSALISSGVLWSFLLDSVAFVIFFGILRIISTRFNKNTTFGGYIK